MVGDFISICEELDKEEERNLPELPLVDDRARKYRGRKYSSASSIGSSISEGHVSPEDDGPSKKVVRYDDKIKID